MLQHGWGAAQERRALTDLMKEEEMQCRETI